MYSGITVHIDVTIITAPRSKLPMPLLTRSYLSPASPANPLRLGTAADSAKHGFLHCLRLMPLRHLLLLTCIAMLNHRAHRPLISVEEISHNEGQLTTPGCPE
jgi:hypothetical protein